MAVDGVVVVVSNPSSSDKGSLLGIKTSVYTHMAMTTRIATPAFRIVSENF